MSSSEPSPSLPTLKLKLKPVAPPPPSSVSGTTTASAVAVPVPSAVAVGGAGASDKPKIVLSLKRPSDEFKEEKHHGHHHQSHHSSSHGEKRKGEEREKEKKKKKKSTAVDQDADADLIPPAELRIVLGRLTMAVRQCVNDEGRNLAALFLALPSKQLYPDYYILIKHPTALNIMQQKINAGKYHSIADLKAEMQLMVENAKTYNSPESLIYEDAVTLWNVFNAEVAKVKAQYRKQSSANNTDIDILGGGGGGSSSAAASLKFKLKPEVEQEMVENRDGKKIPKKELDLLFRAIEDNNVKAFERAIHQVKIHPNTLHKAKIDGIELEWGPLHAVSYYGRAKMLDILVGQKADLELRDTTHGSTPLMWAAYAGKVNTAKRLMRNNRPDKFAKNVRGQTAMDLALDPENPEWRGILNNETPVLTLDKTGMPLDGSRRDRERERRVSKLPVPEADSPGQSFQKITYVGDMSLPDASAHPTRSGNKSQVKDTTPMVRPTMPVDLNKVPKWAKLPNTKDPNQLFLAAGSKELAILLEAPPIKDIEVPLPTENLTHLLHPGLKTPRANAITVSRTIQRLPIRFYLANGNKGVYYSIQVYQNRTPLLPTLLNGGTEECDDREPTVVEVVATLWEGVNVFDVIVFLCRKAEPKGAAALAAAERALEEGGVVVEEFVGIQKKGHHAFQKTMLIVHKG
ncbi:UNVERIFIED_CONTAM: hypothetical protein HDU68_007864 [Siphonaria sp. JEL0065]|nr:hypothetical protein HDU68_007864 [Siphonaria sp. JEL0065]